MMTGGVAMNIGVVKALEEKLDSSLVISENAQVTGAIGAALIAADKK
jgi:activator of 2-hydroxyglutaryl-CoA dehydratase